ncbi:DUF1289 domain-containing protein [Shewanella sp. Isolate11]|uniref:DUF1289 domain-containing protein n=1 Tax=Shewanella sp. Isolate11 TaxID=2908530 RepID=UPI001EFD2BD9|nr:DUF1289 domain-containing protein [Shewanella sp. Isolate11]MCG9696416.1 DUF1289 domain-containing protein [Shewanella sp. Isolate11]
MQSPCVARCGLNDDDICMGCFRHIDEIVGWSQADYGQKQLILQKLPQRKAHYVDDKNNQIISRQKWLAAEARLNLND